MKHAMVKMLCQQLHFAPIGLHPQEILDIGTGTGIWAIESGFLPDWGDLTRQLTASQWPISSPALASWGLT